MTVGSLRSSPCGTVGRLHSQLVRRVLCKDRLFDQLLNCLIRLRYQLQFRQSACLSFNLWGTYVDSILFLLCDGVVVPSRIEAI